MVTQESFLFNGTIRENLQIGKPDASDEELMEAAEAANARSFIDLLRNGLSSVVGERGVKLSVGEKQRLSIARALLKDPPILVLDEATASVDTAMICVSIQYLQQPVVVLRDLVRVLRPGARLVISFSNRCFWTKAVAIWRALDDDGHARLVERYLRHAGFEQIETHRLAEWVEDVSDPMTAVVGRCTLTQDNP